MLEAKPYQDGLRIRKEVKYVPDEIKDKTAKKKQEVLDLISTGSQLNMLALLIEQIGDAINLDTPEFQEAKATFAEIKRILSK